MIMNTYHEEPTLHSQICRTHVSTYSGQLWDSEFNHLILQYREVRPSDGRRLYTTSCGIRADYHWEDASHF